MNDGKPYKQKTILVNGHKIDLIPYGYCTCGCGGKTNLARQTSTERGWIKGKPIKYIQSHNMKFLRQYQILLLHQQDWNEPIWWNTNKYCQCGCGQKTKTSTITDKKKGIKRGFPNRYIHNHHLKGERNNKWNGGKTERNGYIFIRQPDHPRAHKPNGYVSEHILIAESALGKPLPKDAVVHHANGTRNSGPLVICQNELYHKLLHIRMRAYKACGHASWRKCHFCHQYDDPKNMTKTKNKNVYYHKRCHADYENLRRRKKAGFMKQPPVVEDRVEI